MTEHQTLAILVRSLGFLLLADAILLSPRLFPQPEKLLLSWQRYASGQRPRLINLPGGDS